ncbi:sugar phosphate isomerase/epimerase [Halostagnicola sp. A-GB9-2]|uniref:sugar phosphate isomerase/epimerase family protein n=1 Tax=Halostagnicola sp. A-GB9-2 TaxID=3048066 RepID=UPI0024BFAA1D|nr:sugar phosphate isomerase/epimerase [Halostagnicola sp. A-GB9-2]MDJ1434665.1 sugar phosphate isomerase/epimerase [Halostagnicola sp. A-GB9-2]
MSDSTQTDRENERTSTESGYNANRRRVLQGIGAIGVGSAAIGTAQAAQSTRARTSAYGSTPAAQSSEAIETSAQFWSFTEADLSTAELIRECADAGYDAVEPFMIDDADEIADALDETDVHMGSAHVGLEELEEDFDGTIETYSQFGSPALVEPMVADGTWSDEDSVIEFAERCNEMADRVADEGLEFGYHNHDHEFQQIGDTTAYDIFAENINDNVHLQLDAGWVLVGGEDPIDYVIEYSDNVQSIHMKNMTASGDFVEVDEGHVNMRAVATAARNAADVDYLVYEYDQAPNPLESIKIGAEWMSKLNHPYSPGGVCGIEGAEEHPAKL